MSALLLFIFPTAVSALASIFLMAIIVWTFNDEFKTDFLKRCSLQMFFLNVLLYEWIAFENEYLRHTMCAVPGYKWMHPNLTSRSNRLHWYFLKCRGAATDINISLTFSTDRLKHVPLQLIHAASRFILPFSKPAHSLLWNWPYILYVLLMTESLQCLMSQSIKSLVIMRCGEFPSAHCNELSTKWCFCYLRCYYMKFRGE